MATEKEYVQPSIPHFDGDYDHWSMLMETFLRSKQYWLVVSNGFTDPATEAEFQALTDAQKARLEDSRLKDLNAKNYLFQAIDRSILQTILHKDTSKQIWDSMKKKYQGSARAKRVQLQALRTEFETLHMKLGESISDYFSRTMVIANKMRIYGENVEDVIIIEKILRSMTAKFSHVVCSIEEANDLDNLSIDELQSSLMVHELRLNQYDKEEQALQVSTNNHSSTWRGRGRGQRGRGRSDRNYLRPGESYFKPDESPTFGSHGRGRGGGRGGYSNGRGGHSNYNNYRPFDMSNVECYRCHRYGHYSYDCETNMNTGIGEKSNYAENDEEEVSLLLACQERLW